MMNLKVLVVDDNEINRIVARKVLAKWDILTDIADNGEIAIEMILSKKYDLILMDINMPVMGGMEATKIIRKMEDSYFINLPIIALTASNQVDELKDIYLSGMTDYQLKPFVQEDLINKIKKYTTGYSLEVS